jgi:hypothetical protein
MKTAKSQLSQQVRLCYPGHSIVKVRVISSTRAARHGLGGAAVASERPAQISLTEKGRSLEIPALQAAIDANNSALAGVAPEDIAVCMRVLDKALANLLDNGISIETVAEVDAMIE